MSTPRLDPTTAAFIAAVTSAGGPPIYTLPYADARAVLEGAQAGMPADAGVETSDHALPDDLTVRIFRPKDATGPLPILMYYHGGGWVLGSQRTHARLAGELAVGAGAAIVFPNYTPSPEAQFPVPLEQSFAATKWTIQNAALLGLDASRLAVAGDSVGGNMTIAMTQLAKTRGGPAIRYQVLLYPVTDATFTSASYAEFADGPWLTKPAMEWFWNAYAPNVADRENILTSPLRASVEELRGLPPALLITDENDVLRDEGEAYAHRLAAAGVEVTAVRYLGTIHDFMMLNGVSATPAARSAIALTIAKLREVFSK